MSPPVIFKAFLDGRMPGRPGCYHSRDEPWAGEIGGSGDTDIAGFGSGRRGRLEARRRARGGRVLILAAAALTFTAAVWSMLAGLVPGPLARP